ncbi:immunity 50 family protein [Pseudomonas sp. 6D_7.1_Bac1]|uniref:immunity 50 family protein n=1 Tax=Pseudomonas sp. 6D_7.1_Bac1 TaxID=2971615 RepID=UPI0021C8676D|nr:immunity 50 family protein [Pseudomonas sp. 6D_7.1_Bac1]MCU1752884.1 immunity 50 family protein [Pseudomonas sp. 6D_7.1_Bac1]
MKFWNDIDGSTFFNQVFTTSVAIGPVELFTVNIDNSRPTIILEFDIEELPDAPPAKWKKAAFNTCRIGLNCGGVSNLTIKNIPTKEKLNITITQKENLFTIHASNNNSLIEFTTKFPLLCGPSVYMNDKYSEAT